MGNVYMEADQVRFKDSTYRNVQEGLAAALEGGGGGGTAADVSYDNTDSGLTAETVQAAIDEVVTDLDALSTTVGDSSEGLVKDVADIQDLIPSGATSENKLATEDDIPDENVYSSTEAKVGTWDGSDLYRKKVSIGALPNTALKSFDIGITTETVCRIEMYYTSSAEYGPFPNNEGTASFNKSTKKLDVATSSDYSGFTGVVIVEYTKAS